MKKEIRKEKVNAVCPHCLKEISMVWVCKVESVIGMRYVFFCGECQKNLGISHEKGFASRITNSTLNNSVSVVNNPM